MENIWNPSQNISPGYTITSPTEERIKEIYGKLDVIKIQLHIFHLRGERKWRWGGGGGGDGAGMGKGVNIILKIKLFQNQKTDGKTGLVK